MLRLWDGRTGGAIHEFRGHIDGLAAGALSKDRRWALFGATRRSVGRGAKPPLYLWDLESASLRRVLVDHEEAIRSVAFSPDGTLAVSGAADHSLVVWDVATGAPTQRFVDMTAGGTPTRIRGAIGVAAVAFAPDGRSVAAACSDGLVRIWRLSDGSMTTTGEGSESVEDITYLPDGDLLAAGWSHELRRYGPTGELRWRTRAHERWHISLAASADGRRALTVALDRMAHVWDLESGRRLRTLDAKLFPPAAISPDGQLVAASTGDAIALYGADLGREKGQLRGHRGAITSLSFSSDGKHIASTSNDGTARMWHLAGGHSLSLLAADEQWLIYGDDGLFDASRRGGELVAAVEGLRGYRIDQMAVRNNRPHELLERMGLGTPEAIAHFDALHRRLRQLGLDESTLAESLERAPRVEFEGEASDGVAELRIQLEAGGAPVTRYQVYANAVPLFGPEGKPAGNTAIVERVELTTGANVIEVGAFDAAGLESLRRARSFRLDRQLESDLHFIVLSSSTGDELSYELDELQNGVFTEEVLTALTSPAADLNHDRELSAVELRTFIAQRVAERTGGRQHPVIDRDNPSSDLRLPLLPLSAIPPESPLSSPSSPTALEPGPRGCACTLPASGGGGRPWLWVTGLAIALLRRRRSRVYR